MENRSMWMQQSTETATSITAKAGPPAAVIAASLMGVPVDDWIKWITLAYVILMVLHKLWHMAVEAYQFWVLRRRDPPSSSDE